MSELAPDFREEYLIPKDLTVAQLEKDVRAALSDAATTDPELWKDAQSQGLTPNTRLFDLKGKQGTDPATAALLVTLAVAGAKLGVKIAGDIWTKIILPRLEEKYGRKSFAKKK